MNWTGIRARVEESTTFVCRIGENKTEHEDCLFQHSDDLGKCNTEVLDLVLGVACTMSATKSQVIWTLTNINKRKEGIVWGMVLPQNYPLFAFASSKWKFGFNLIYYCFFFVWSSHLSCPHPYPHPHFYTLRILDGCFAGTTLLLWLQDQSWKSIVKLLIYYGYGTPQVEKESFDSLHILLLARLPWQIELPVLKLHLDWEHWYILSPSQLDCFHKLRLGGEW